MVNFAIQITGCDSHNPAVLDLYVSSDASVCSTTAFPPLGNFDHVDASISIGFLKNSKGDNPFPNKAYNYSHSDWDDLHDYLKALTKF